MNLYKWVLLRDPSVHAVIVVLARSLGEARVLVGQMGVQRGLWHIWPQEDSPAEVIELGECNVKEPRVVAWAEWSE